jgi:hypothetical protein
VLDKTYKIGNKTINLPIVVKVENEQNEKPYFSTDILDNKLYIAANS